MPKKRKRRIREGENDNPRKSFLRRILKGSIFSALVFFAVLLISALVTMKTSLSDTMQNFLVFFSSLLGPFAGAFLALHKTREKGLLSGVLVSVPVIVLVCIVLLAVVGTLGIKTLIMALLMMLGGALGGIAAVNK